MTISGNRSGPRIAAVLGLLYLAIYIAPLGLRPLSSPDEVRYGAVSREMIESGDWVSPRLNGVRYFEKPILGYWLDSASMRLLGENAFALRLPTALAAGLSALLVFALTLRFATRFSAFLASGIYLTTFLVLVVGTTAVFDGLLTLFLTGALASYYVALTERLSSRRRLALLACGAFCAGAFLTKGFLGLAIPVLVAVPYLAAQRRWRALFTWSWLPIVAAACLALPWAVLIHIREPDFWHYFFWVEHIQRFAGSEAQHAEAFWFYFRLLPLIGWPWIWMLPAAIAGLRANAGDRSFLLYLACWTVLPWIFFSVSKGKLTTYVLPCFPPLSILLAIGLENYFVSGRWRAWRIGAAAVGLLMAAALVVVAAAQAGAFGDPPYGRNESVRFGLLIACIAGGVGAAAIAGWFRSSASRAFAMAAAGVALFLPLQAGMPQRVLDNLAPRGFIGPESLAGTGTVLVADAPMFASVAWYSKRDDIYVLSAGEISYGMAYPESRERNLENGGLADLIEANRERHDVLIICRETSEMEIRGLLPERARRTEIGRVIVWRIPA